MRGATGPRSAESPGPAMESSTYEPAPSGENATTAMPCTAANRSRFRCVRYLRAHVGVRAPHAYA